MHLHALIASVLFTLHAHATPPWPTTVWSTVESTSSFIQFIDERAWTAITTRTVSSLEPALAQVTAYPGTAIETVIEHITVETRLHSLTPDPTTRTDISTSTYIHSKTYILSPVKPTDLPSGSSIPCNACSSAATAGTDPQCSALGLKTGCQAQCESRDNLWWCLLLHTWDYRFAEERMGRACWGEKNQYRQLNTPCEAGDYQMACTPCKGVDDSWGALTWV